MALLHRPHDGGRRLCGCGVLVGLSCVAGVALAGVALAGVAVLAAGARPWDHRWRRRGDRLLRWRGRCRQGRRGRGHTPHLRRRVEHQRAMKHIGLGGRGPLPRHAPGARAGPSAGHQAAVCQRQCVAALTCAGLCRDLHLGDLDGLQHPGWRGALERRLDLSCGARLQHTSRGRQRRLRGRRCCCSDRCARAERDETGEQADSGERPPAKRHGGGRRGVTCTFHRGKPKRDSEQARRACSAILNAQGFRYK